MAKEGFVFYISFFAAINVLDPEKRLQCYEAIMNYAFTGNIPEYDDPVVSAIFIMAKPQIDANYKRRENGKLGGRPKKEADDGTTSEEHGAENASDIKGSGSSLKKAYGEFGNVMLTDEEVEKLRAKCSCVDEAIALLDEYIESKGTNSKSHYADIIRWVIDAVKAKKSYASKKHISAPGSTRSGEYGDMAKEMTKLQEGKMAKEHMEKQETQDTTGKADANPDSE